MKALASGGSRGSCPRVVSGGRPSEALLLCRVGARLCGLRLQHVVETMRPLPVEPLRGAPTYVRGLALVRGAPTPVLDLAALLGGAPSSPGRFVTVTARERSVALAVDEVVGIREVPAAWLDELPPLVREVGADVVAAIGVADATLLLVVESARLLPDELRTALDDASPPP